MSKVAVITDSNSGITQEEGKRLGISVLPMPFFINDELFFEDITLTQPEFYRHLEAGAEIKTSQPAIGAVTDLWDRALETHDEVVYIPMSSGLSNSCETAIMLSEEYGGRVRVVDNQRISWTQKQSVIEAITLAERGLGAEEIQRILERSGLDASIYIAVDTLKYLKKGGRITPAAASIGAVLNIKPVLQIQGDKLDAFAKVRGMKQAKARMLDAIEKDKNERFAGCQTYIYGAYTCSEEEARTWESEIRERFPEHTVYLDKLSLSVSCHIGAGSMAIVCMKVLDETGYLDYQEFLKSRT